MTPHDAIGTLFTVGSLFSGIGGLDLAAQWAGFETAWFVEKEPFPQQVLRKHWPDVPLYDDVFECHDLPYVDVIVGGFPCQPFSVAGKRQGADDERFLLPEMLRIIREVKPYAVLFENVPGFPSLNDGAEFKYLLRALAEMGFDAEWGHLRASDCGAPHQRERWFCVAYRAGYDGSVAPAVSRQTALYGREGETVRSGSRAQSMAYAGCPERREGDTKHNQVVTRTICLSQRKKNTGGLSQRSKTVAYAQSTKRKCASGTRRGRAGLTDGSRYVGDTTSQRLQGKRASREQVTHLPARQVLPGRSGATARNGGTTQPLMGGNTYGFPGGLDFVGWPANPGEAQYDYEPPRVTSGRTPNRAARLKALGNAVVPQVVYPLFVAIKEWLEERMIEEAA